MADPRLFDPVVQAEKAQELRALATRAREALRTETVARTSRLGVQRDEAAREVYASEQEIAAADQQVKRELAVAENYEKEAAALERKASGLERNASGSVTAEGEAEELREQAAEQRALATAARQRIRAAEETVDRLEDELLEKRLEVERLEQQLAAEPERRAQIEREVDNLEWHARSAEGFARNVEVMVEEENEAAAAERSGDTVAAAAARARAADLREGIEALADIREATTLFAPDAQKLAMIGITLPETFFETPGFSPTPAAPPATESEPTSRSDDARTQAPDDDVLAAELEIPDAGDDEVSALPTGAAGDVAEPAQNGDVVVLDTVEDDALPGAADFGVVEPAMVDSAADLAVPPEDGALPGAADFGVAEPAVDGEAVTDDIADDISIDSSIDTAIPQFTSVSDESDAVLAHFFEPEPEPDVADLAADVDEPAEFLEG